jgi:hypothetical protein
VQPAWMSATSALQGERRYCTTTAPRPPGKVFTACTDKRPRSASRPRALQPGGPCPDCRTRADDPRIPCSGRGYPQEDEENGDIKVSEATVCKHTFADACCQAAPPVRPGVDGGARQTAADAPGNGRREVPQRSMARRKGQALPRKRRRGAVTVAARGQCAFRAMRGVDGRHTTAEQTA